MNNLQSKRIKASQLVLIGTICGDIIGSCYEWQSTKRYDFKLLSEYSRFTDDTVCSVAMADALVRNIPLTYILNIGANGIHVLDMDECSGVGYIHS